MATISLPVILGLLSLFMGAEPDVELAHPALRLLWILASLWGPALGAYAVGVAIRRHTRDDTLLRRAWTVRMRRFLGVTELFLVGVFVFHALAGSLTAVLESYAAWLPFENIRRVVAIVPFILALLIARLAAYELQRRQGARYRPFLALQLKLVLLPLIPVLLYVAVADLFEFAPLGARLTAASHPFLIYIFPLALIVGAYTFAPALLRLLWPADPIEDIDLRLRVREIAERHRLAYRRISIWRTGDVRIANAAVAGLFARTRELFVTDWLLGHMDLEEVEGVLAHELGHIKHRHLWLYLVFSFNYFGVYLVVLDFLRPRLPSVFIQSTLGQFIVIALFFYVYFVLILGFLSRRFERQADLFAVRNCRNPDAFVRALAKLADLHSLPTRIRRLFELTRTHPSIGRRIEFAGRAIAGDPAVEAYARPLFVSRAVLVAFPVIILVVFLTRDTLFGSSVDVAETRATMLLTEVERLQSDTQATDADAARRIRRQIEQLNTRAQRELEPLLARKPGNVDALYLYGLAQMYADELDGAQETFRQILRREPEHVGALYGMASLAADTEDWTRAEAFIDRASRLRPRNRQIEALRQRIRAEAASANGAKPDGERREEGRRDER